MPRYESGPLVRRATGPVLAVLAVLALLAAVAAGPATPAVAAQASPAASRSAASSASPLAVSLEQAFAAARHLPSSAIGGVRAGTLHQGSVSGAGWALASFVPSASAGNLAAGFADGAATGVFRRSGGVWHLARTGPYGCGAGLPASLKQAWRLAGPATCSASPATGHAAAQHALSVLPAASSLRQAIASTALRQVGVSTTPAETSFSGVDCDPFSTMVAGFSANADGCGYDQHFGVEDENEEWCADFNKWVWQQAGVTAGMDTLNAAASSFYAWGQDQGETLTPGQGTPQVGDSIAFFGPGTVSAAAYADHVGVVTSVNPDGTINMVNGDFLGSSQISVEYNTNLDLSTWPASEWGAGEQWVIITPPADAQPPVPRATMTGPDAAATGTAAAFHATASEPGGSVSQYYWTFGDGRSANSTAGPTVSHVFHETGTYTVTVTVTSNRGSIRTLTRDVAVNGASSAAAAVPSDAVWYATAPVDEYLFTHSAGGLAADLWDGASWLQVTVPGQPDASGPVTALSYPDPAVSDAMTPHAYYRAADGSLAETWLGATGWVTQELPGQPAAGSAITAAFTSGGPAVFYVGAGGRLAETSQQASGWTATTLPGAAVRPASAALAATAAGPVLAATTSGGALQVTARDGGHWSSATLPVHPAPDQPLAAATTSAGQPRVFFTRQGGGLAATTRSQGSRWTAAGLPGRPAHGAALAATSYLIPGSPVPGTPPASTTPPGSEPPGSLPEGRIGDTSGQEVFYLGAGGHPAVDYSVRTGGWRTAALPGPASGIAGADAYLLPGLPSQLFASVPGGGLQADTTGSSADPSGAWSAEPLPATPATMADRVVLYAATASDAATAQAAASAAGLPAAQVTRSFATAWADTLSGDYLVIAAGQAATGALDYNECGWANPSTAVGGSTPFYIVTGPLAALPGADAYESGTAAATQTQARTTDLAYYALHGSLPTGVTSLPAAASPQRACSGSPS